MNSEEENSGVVSVATGGIQDVSALLPILGTEQCEKLVTSALEKGWLYAAATPMSIFGSLGIVKAGFVVLWGTIDLELFPGPKFLTDAGFAPSGIGELLIPVKTDNRDLYVAEDKLHRHCSGIKIKDVNIDLGSKDLWSWNLWLILGTTVLSSLGLLPYVCLIGASPPDTSFWATWLYPTLRVVGNDLVVVLIQLIFQFRILEEVDCRLRFAAADIYLKELGVSVPSFWDPNKRSKHVLNKSMSSDRSWSSDRGPRWSENRPSFLQEGGKLTSFTVPVNHQRDSDGDHNRATARVKPGPSLDEGHRTHLSSDHDVAEKGASKPETLSLLSTPPPESLPQSPRKLVNPAGRGSWRVSSLLWIGRFLLLLGLGLSVVGYIGCFSVVQKNPRNNPQGPLIWLVCEAALSILRTLTWAWNPGWDDAPSPIVWKKAEVQEKQNLYGLGWTLESLTANNVHALIIGLDSAKEPGKESSQVLSATESAKEVAKYVQSTLLVPRGQVTLLLNENATKKKITKAFKALSRRVEAESAIIVYISMPSVMLVDGPHFTPFQGDQIPFSRVIDLLGRSEEKSDNITLIIESPYASAMGENNKLDSRHTNEQGTLLGTTGLVGHSSHILLGAIETQPGGSLTKKLLEVLRSDDNSSKLPTMSYKDLVKLVNSVSKETRPPAWRTWPWKRGPANPTQGRPWWKVWQRRDPVQRQPYQELPPDTSRPTAEKSFCTTLYQHRLLFGGLFSRKVDENPDPVFTITYSDLISGRVRNRAGTVTNSDVRRDPDAVEADLAATKTLSWPQ